MCMHVCNVMCCNVLYGHVVMYVCMDGCMYAWM